VTDTETQKYDWRCHLGRHHYVRRIDDNPEVRGQSVLICTRCGGHEDGPQTGPGSGSGLRGIIAG
jgi:predicted SprT family Zn-dependent metalloprotease